MIRIFTLLIITLGTIAYAVDCDSEIQFLDTPNGKVVEFIGFPENTEITIQSNRLFQKPSKKGFSNIEKIRIDAEGHLHLFKSKQVVARISLESTGRDFLKGERTYFRFLDNNGIILGETSFIPRPIKTSSKNNTFTLEAEIISISPTIYQLHLTGIGSKETIHVKSTSSNEVTEFDTSYTPDNIIAISPTIKDKKGGLCQLEVSRRNGDSAQLRLNWGTSIAQEFVNHVKGEKYEASKL